MSRVAVYIYMVHTAYVIYTVYMRLIYGQMYLIWHIIYVYYTYMYVCIRAKSM
jgi:hypothetical protein